MKRVCVCIGVMMCAVAHGQSTFSKLEESEQRVFKGGLIMGMNICQVDGDTYAGYNKVGIHAGGAVNIRLGKKINLSTELVYSQKGARGAHTIDSYYMGTYFDKYYLNLNYIELPLVLQYKHTLLWGFELGLSYDRLISSKEWAFSYVPAYIRPEVNYFNSSNISYMGGAYYFINNHWMANARLQYSLTPIRPWNRTPEPYTMYVNQYSNVITLRLVYVL